jgi:hypothetical protein
VAEATVLTACGASVLFSKQQATSGCRSGASAASVVVALLLLLLLLLLLHTALTPLS